ncbi:ester cyclase [Geodermatophilus sp. URMC 63]
MPEDAEEVRTLVRGLADAMNTRRLELLDDVLAPDVVRHCRATPHLSITDREQFKEFLRQDAEIFPDNVQTFTQVLVDGDRAAVRATYEGTQTGPMGPFPPSGEKASSDFAGVFRVRDGRIAEMWLVWDNVTVLSQLGHLPG